MVSSGALYPSKTHTQLLGPIRFITLDVSSVKPAVKQVEIIGGIFWIEDIKPLIFLTSLPISTMPKSQNSCSECIYISF